MYRERWIRTTTSLKIIVFLSISELLYVSLNTHRIPDSPPVKMPINCPFYRLTSYRVQTPSWSFYWSSMTFLELREGLEPTKSFLHSFADCVLCRSDSPQHIKEDLYWIHFNELNSGDAPPTQYKSCFNNGGRYRAYGGRLMRPAGRLLRPARQYYL